MTHFRFEAEITPGMAPGQVADLAGIVVGRRGGRSPASWRAAA